MFLTLINEDGSIDTILNLDRIAYIKKNTRNGKYFIDFVNDKGYTMCSQSFSEELNAEKTFKRIRRELEKK